MVKNLKPALLVTALLLNIAWFGPAHAKSSPDGHTIPIVVSPGSTSISQGANVTVTVTMDRASTSAEVVSLSSDWVSITVPSSVTVPAGDTTFTFTAHRASTDDPNYPMPTTTHFTASTPDGYAQGGITNNSSDPG